MLVETYGEHASVIRTCETWFRQFKSGDFDLADDEHPGAAKKFEDEELQALLDEDPTQSQQQLAQSLNVTREAICQRLKAMGKIQKYGKCVPHPLNDSQMENRKTIREMLLQRFKRKSFLHRIVTGDGKWIYSAYLKWKKSWLSPGEVNPSTPRPNRFGRKTMLCVWWDQCGVVYFELLKSDEMVNTYRYRQQIINFNHALIEKRPEWAEDVAKLSYNMTTHGLIPLKW